MSMLSLRRSQKQSGFTLMELLIVIAVLGLLLGMLIPRLAGVTDDTVDTVCDSNNKGIRYYTQIYYNTEGELPNNLTNLVDSSVTGSTTATHSDYIWTQAAYLPGFEDDTNSAAEVIAQEFYSRNVPGSYQLSEAEVNELNDMGITSVYDYVGNDGTNDRSMYKHTLAEDDYVMMMGVTSTSSSAATLNFAATDPIGNPEWIGRIMMAVNDKCDLVKSGLIQASALCPGAVLAEEDFEHKEYVLILPRLEATVTKLSGAIAKDADVVFVAVDSTGRTADASGRLLDFVFEAQDAWNFDMSCPEGHKWPDNDDDAFIYTIGSGASGITTLGSAYSTAVVE